jgi:hypothetical protein
MKRKSRRAWAERQAWLADEALLIARLRRLGLHGVEGIHVHQNRTVMVRVTDRGILRIHRGYAYASDAILRAVVTYVGPGVAGGEAEEALQAITEFPVEVFVPQRARPRRRRERNRGEIRILAELGRLHRELNRQYFGDSLSSIAFRLSRRMETRLGELTVDIASNKAIDIAISQRHLEQDGWDEVRHTLLHEMVHQWQVESGLEPDHGKTFRRKAKELGIAPTAERDVVAVNLLALEV